MPTILKCPACSAPLSIPGPLDAATRCPYCGAGVMLASRHGHAQPSSAPDPHVGIDPEVVRLVGEGKLIHAIKLHRERTGLPLKEAKEAVDRIAAGLPGGHPGPGPGRGCGMLVVVVVAALIGLAYTIRQDQKNRPAAAPRPSVPAPAAAPAFAEELLRFGSEGTGAGRFTDARSVAVDGAGRIYVAEYQGGRVQVFDSAGAFVTQWMADPAMPLVDMEAGRDGTVYVVQSGRIRRYDGATGEQKGEVPRPDRWTSISDVALALDGTVWTVMGHDRVVQLGRDGGVRRSINLPEAVGASASPERVAVAGTGDVYVLDRVSDEIYRFGPDGRFMDRFGGRGEGAESTSSPEDVAIDGRGRVYVSDLGEGIRVFDAGGRYIGEFGGREVVFGLEIDDRDQVFGAFRNRHEVAKFRVNR